jgi:hypothetical protein
MASPRPWLGIDHELRLAASEALSTVDLSDPAMLEAYDEIAACTRATGLSFREAAESCGRPVMPAMQVILALGWLYHWDEGGSNALLGLSASLDEPAEDADVAAWTLHFVTRALVLPAASLARGSEVLESPLHGEVGARLEALARWLEAQGHSNAACECALLAAHLQRRAGDGAHHSTGQLALRLLNRSPRLATLPRVPRAKYPARDAPALPPEATEELVCSMLTQLLFQGPPGTQVPASELDTISRGMLLDQDQVLHCPVNGHYQLADGQIATLPVERFEMRFATPLLRRIAGWVDLASADEVSMHLGLTDLVMQLLSHRAGLEHRRDPYLHDWYELRGELPWRHGALFTDVAVCVQSIGRVMFAVVGERADDIDNWQLFERHAQTARDFLHRARSALA